MLKFSVFIPTFNAGRWLDQCLKSISSQDYQPDKIEIIVADGGSTDNTLEIARQYSTRILNNPKKLAHYAFEAYGRESTGDLVVMFAADNELVGNDWFRTVNEYFERNERLAALWGRQEACVGDSAANHYYELIQNDPLSHFTNRNLLRYMREGQTIGVGGRQGKIFDVDVNRPLVWGANGLVLRMSCSRDFFTAGGFVGDNDIFQNMIEAGNTLVAYVPSLRIIHHHIESVGDWRRKLERNYRRHFLQHHEQRNMGWAFGRGFYWRLALWIVYAGVPVFSGADALWRSARERNIHWLYHPVFNFVQLYTIATLTLFTKEGRVFLRSLLKQES